MKKPEEDLFFLESNGPLCKYLDSKTNSIVYADGAFEVPGKRKIVKYKGIITWVPDLVLTCQINNLRKVCKKYIDLSMESILKSARNNDSWEFGSFYKEEAVDILELANEYNMNIEMINEDSGEKLIIQMQKR